jgi:starvation-inducible DNA-binding protein
MHNTRNDLPSRTRVAVAELLQARLADAVDFHSQAKQAHWTVKGPAFIALHELFDKVAAEADGWADLIAERIEQLGGTAEGTVRVAAKRSTLKEYPPAITAGLDHVNALSSSLAGFGTNVRADIDHAAKLDDAGSADLFTEISRAADKLLWFVESHAT